MGWVGHYMSLLLSRVRCINLVTHCSIQHKSLRKLLSEYEKLSSVVKDYLNNFQGSYSVDVALLPKKLSHINETIVRICAEFASTRDIVNIYHTFSKSYLYTLLECPNSLDFISIDSGYDLVNQISKDGNLKFTLFSLEQQCLKLITVIYPYQIAILISSHLRMGRCNEVFITELLNSFAGVNTQESKVRIPFYNPNTLSLMAHIAHICRSKGIDIQLLDRVIEFILVQSKGCVNKFTPLDTVTLTYSLVKYGWETSKISEILLLVLTHGTYDINMFQCSIGRFEDLQQLSLLANVLSWCFPVTNALVDSVVDLDFKINMWSIVLAQYFKLLTQLKLDGIDLIMYSNVVSKFGIEFNTMSKEVDEEFSMQKCEKLTNSLVSFAKAFELDYSTDEIRLTKCGKVVKSKQIIYRIYRSVERHICSSEQHNVAIDIGGDLFYGIYGQFYIIADIVCRMIKSNYLHANVKFVALQTFSNSLNALSRLHIQQ